MQAAVQWEELGIANPDRRREDRIVFAMSIEVTGFDLKGRFFTEVTVTIDISESGCAFPLRRCVERGGIVSVKAIAKEYTKQREQRPLLYQISRATSEDSRWIHGAAKLQSASIWHLAFPESAAAEIG